MSTEMVILATEMIKLGVQIALRAGASEEDVEVAYQTAKMEFAKRPASELPEVE